MIETTTTTSSTAVVERFVRDVMSGGRPESASELIANEPLRQRVDAFRSAFADLKVHITRLVAAERLVAVHLVATGTHTGSFQGSPPTGRSWTSSCTAIYEVRDGRIVDFFVTWDLLDILEQLHIVRRTSEASA